MSWLLAAWIGCQVLDMGTTYTLLHSGQFREGNAILGSGARLYALKVTINVGMFGVHRYVKDAHPNVTPIIMAVGGCAAGTWNLSQFRRLR